MRRESRSKWFLVKQVRQVKESTSWCLSFGISAVIGLCFQPSSYVSWTGSRSYYGEIRNSRDSLYSLKGRSLIRQAKARTWKIQVTNDPRYDWSTRYEKNEARWTWRAWSVMRRMIECWHDIEDRSNPIRDKWLYGSWRSTFHHHFMRDSIDCDLQRIRNMEAH